MWLYGYLFNKWARYPHICLIISRVPRASYSQVKILNLDLRHSSYKELCSKLQSDIFRKTTVLCFLGVLRMTLKTSNPRVSWRMEQCHSVFSPFWGWKAISWPGLSGFHSCFRRVSYLTLTELSWQQELKAMIAMHLKRFSESREWELRAQTEPHTDLLSALFAALLWPVHPIHHPAGHH